MSDDQPSREDLLARIAELEEEKQHLTQLAYYDALTGIGNRLAFGEAFGRVAGTLFRAFEANRRAGGHLPLLGTDVCLVSFDLDHFKIMNDEHRDKHLAGDRALVAFARLLRETFRRPEDVVARHGGDEFIALLPNTSVEHATLRCQTLQGNLLDLDELTIRGDLRITTSIGITTLMVSNHAHSSAEIIESAQLRMERALSQGKGKGRNIICHHAPAVREILEAAE